MIAPEFYDTGSNYQLIVSITKVEVSKSEKLFLVKMSAIYLINLIHLNASN